MMMVGGEGAANRKRQHVIDLMISKVEVKIEG